MFGHTSFTVSPQRSTISIRKPLRMQSPGPARSGVPPKSRCASPTQPSPRRDFKPNLEHEVSERFKNHAYNRQPSPMGRFLAPGRNSKDTPSPYPNRESGQSARERMKPTPPKSAVPQRTVAESRSVDMRKWIKEQRAEEESRGLTERARPKTTEQMRANNKPALMESPSFENRVFLAVKDVLSRAVLEKGKIDVNNINNIIDDMKNRLVPNETVNNDSDEENIAHDVNLKESTTTVNIEPVLISKTNSYLIPKAKPVPGIMRRNIVEPTKKIQKIYKKVYNKDDLPPIPPKELSKKHNYEVYGNNYESTVYIDIPDSDYSNFNSIVKKDAEVSKSAQKKKADGAKHLEDLALKKEQLSEASDNDYSLGDSNHKPVTDSGYIEGRGGDCNLETCQPHSFLKTAEDVQLQNYIEALIRNMNDQLNGKTSNRAFENQIETEHTICKSFCVCKVCVSSKTSSSRKTLNEAPSSSSVREKSQSELKLRNSALNNSDAFANSKQLRPETKMFGKDANKETNFRILQRNANFQPESKLNLATRYAIGPEAKNVPNSSGAYKGVASEEASEDLYLQRRIKSKSPVKRRTSAKI